MKRFFYYLAMFALVGILGFSDAMAADPTTQASAITFSKSSNTQGNLAWVRGDGTNRMVVVAYDTDAGGADLPNWGNFQANYGLDAATKDLTNPVLTVAAGDFTSAAADGDNVWTDGANNVRFVVLDLGLSTANSLALTNLPAGKALGFKVYEYNTPGAAAEFLQADAVSNNPRNFANSSFTSLPTTAAGYIAFNAITYNSANLIWNNGTGARRMVVVAFDEDAAGNDAPNWVAFEDAKSIGALTDFSTISANDLNGVYTGTPNASLTWVDPVTNVRYLIIDLLTGSNRTTSLSALPSDNKNYSVKVYEYNMRGTSTNADVRVASNTNNPRTFTTVDAIDAPTLPTVLSYLGRVVTLGWTAPAPAPDTYELTISTATGAAFDSGILSIYNGLDVGNVTTFPAYVEAAGTYYWKVNSVQNGVRSPYSTQAIFEITDATLPTFTAAFNSTNSTLTVTFLEEVTSNNTGIVQALNPASFVATCDLPQHIITLSNMQTTNNRVFTFDVSISCAGTIDDTRLTGNERVTISIDPTYGPIYDRQANMMDENFSFLVVNPLSEATVVLDNQGNGQPYLCYTTIQAAVNAATNNNGDVITLMDGTIEADPDDNVPSVYSENVNLNKSLRITDDGGAPANYSSAEITGTWTITSTAAGALVIDGLTFTTSNSSLLFGNCANTSNTVTNNQFNVNATAEAIKTLNDVTINSLTVGDALNPNTFVYSGTGAATGISVGQTMLTSIDVTNNTFTMNGGSDYAVKFETSAATASVGVLSINNNTFAETAQANVDNAIGFARTYTSANNRLFIAVAVSNNTFNNYGKAVEFIGAENFATVLPTISLAGNTFDLDATAPNTGVNKGFTQRYVTDQATFDASARLYPGTAVWSDDNAIDDNDNNAFNTPAEAISFTTNNTAHTIHLGNGDYSLVDIDLNKAVNLVGYPYNFTTSVGTIISKKLSLNGITNAFTVSNIYFNQAGVTATTTPSVDVAALPLANALTITNCYFDYNGSEAIKVTDKSLTGTLALTTNTFRKNGAATTNAVSFPDNQITGTINIVSNIFNSTTGAITPWTPTSTNGTGIYFSTTNTLGASTGTINIETNLFGKATTTAANQAFSGNGIIFTDAVNNAFSLSGATINIYNANFFDQVGTGNYGIKLFDGPAYTAAAFKTTMPAFIDLSTAGTCNTIDATDVYGAAWFTGLFANVNVESKLYPSIQTAINTDQSPVLNIAAGIYDEDITTVKGAGNEYGLTGILGAEVSGTPVCELKTGKKIILNKNLTSAAGFTAELVEIVKTGVDLQDAVNLVKANGNINVTGNTVASNFTFSNNAVAITKPFTLDGNKDNVVKSIFPNQFNVSGLDASTTKLTIKNLDWTGNTLSNAIAFTGNNKKIDLIGNNFVATSTAIKFYSALTDVTTDATLTNNTFTYGSLVGGSGVLFALASNVTMTGNTLTASAAQTNDGIKFMGALTGTNTFNTNTITAKADGISFASTVNGTNTINGNTLLTTTNGIKFASTVGATTGTTTINTNTITASAKGIDFVTSAKNVTMQTNTINLANTGINFTGLGSTYTDILIGGSTAGQGNTFNFASSTVGEIGIYRVGLIQGNTGFSVIGNTFAMNGGSANTSVGIDVAIASEAGHNVNNTSYHSLFLVEGNTFTVTAGANASKSSALQFFADFDTQSGFEISNPLKRPQINKNQFTRTGYLVWFEDDRLEDLHPADGDPDGPNTRLLTFLGDITLGATTNVNTFDAATLSVWNTTTAAYHGYYTPSNFDNTVTTIYPDCVAPQTPAGNFVSLTPRAITATPNYVAGFINSTYTDGVTLRFQLKDEAQVSDMSLIGGNITVKYSNDGTTYTTLPTYPTGEVINTSRLNTFGYYEVNLTSAQLLALVAENQDIYFQAIVTDVSGLQRTGSASSRWTRDLVAPAAPQLTFNFPANDGLTMQTLPLAVGTKEAGYTSFQFASKRANSGSALWWNQTSGSYDLAAAAWVNVQNVTAATWSHSFSATETDSYEMYVKATDVAGNSGQITRTFNIDNVNPTITNFTYVNPTTYTVVFNKEVESTQADMIANYSVAIPAPINMVVTPTTAVKGAGADVNKVTLTFVAGTFDNVGDCNKIQLTVNNTLPNGVRDIAGNLVNNTARGASAPAGSLNEGLNFNQAKCQLPDRVAPYIVSVARNTTSKGGTEATLANNYLTNAATVTYLVTFNEQVKNNAGADVYNTLTAANFALNAPFAGTVDAVVTTDDINFLVTVAVDANDDNADSDNLTVEAGNNIVDISCTGAHNAYSQAGHVITPEYYLVDRKAPSITEAGFWNAPIASTIWNNGNKSISWVPANISDAGVAGGANVNLAFHFSTNGLTAWDYIGSTTGDVQPLTWNIALPTTTSYDAAKVRIMATDAAGNLTNYVQSASFTLDPKPLTSVITLNSVTLGDNNVSDEGATIKKVTTDATVGFTVTFNKAVDNFNGNDITVNRTIGVAPAAVTYDEFTVTPDADHKVFTVVFTGVVGNGTLGITVNKAALNDRANNTLAEDVTSDLFRIDNTPALPSTFVLECGNTTATATFTEKVFSANNAAGGITSSSASVNDYTLAIAGGTGTLTSWSATATAGATQMTISNIVLGGTIAGTELLSFDFVTGQVYDRAGNVTVAATPNIKDITHKPTLATKATPTFNLAMPRCENGTYTLDGTPVVANGTEATYQWEYQIKGTGAWTSIPVPAPAPEGLEPIPGTQFNNITTPILQIVNPSYADFNNTKFRLVVTNGCTSVTSAEVTMTLYPTTAITTQPVSQQACATQVGSKVFTTVAVGTGLTYTWKYHNGAGWVDANNTTNKPLNSNIVINNGTLTITEPTLAIPANEYKFRCDVASSGVGACAGTVSSNEALFTVQSLATADAGVDKSVCVENPAVTLAGTIGGSATSATWTASVAGGTFTPNANALTVTYTPPVGFAGTTIDLTLTANTSNVVCGNATDVATITYTPIATVTAGPDQIVCGNSPVTLAGDYTVATSATWSGNGTFSNVNSKTSTYTPTPAEIAAGSATLTFTTNAPAGLCSAVSDQVVISILPVPTIQTITGGPFCAGSNIAVALSGTQAGVTYTLYKDGVATTTTLLGNGNNSTFFVNTALAGAYTVKAGACNYPMTGTVTVNPAAVADAGADATTCVATPYTVPAGTASVSNAASYRWTHDGQGTITNETTLTPTYTPSPLDLNNPIVHLGLIVTSNSGCADVVDYKELAITTVPAVPTIAITGTPAPYCGTATTELTATSLGAASYVWYKNGVAIDGQTTNKLTITALATTANYSVEAVNPCGTVASAAATTITVNTPSQITLVSDATLNTICQGQSVVVTASGAATYNWLNGVGTGNVKTLTPSSTTTYNVEGTDANGCVTSATITIIVNPTPTVTSFATNQTRCGNGDVTFTAGTTTANSEIEWATNSAFTGTLTLGNTYTVTLVAGTPATTVYYRAKNANCPSALYYSATGTAFIPAVITITGNTTGLQGADVTLSTSAIASEYIWAADGATITNGTTRNATFNWPTAGVKTLTLDYKDMNGCSGTATYTVTLAPSCAIITSVNISGYTVPVCSGSQLVLTADDNGSGAPTSYVWKLGSTTLATTTKTLTLSNIALADAGVYTVTVSNECTTTPLVSSAVNVVVNPTAVAPTEILVDRNNFCSNDNGNIVLTINGGSGTTLKYATNAAFTGSTTVTGNTVTIPSPATTTTYYARYETVCGNSAAVSVVVTVSNGAVITAQPTNQAISVNNTATFTVTATGAASYAWFNKTATGDVAVGTNSNTLTLSGLTTADYGKLYFVNITSACGDVTVSNTVGLVNTPTVAPTVTVANRNKNYVTLTIGNIGGLNQGTKALVVVEAYNAGTFDFSPVDATNYTGSLVYPVTGVVGTEYVVYNGTSGQITVTGLTRNTQYRFRVYSYNGVEGVTTTNVYAKNPAVVYGEVIVRTTLKDASENEGQLTNNGTFSVSRVNPNPVQNEINFSVEALEEANYTIELFNVNGEVVMSQSQNFRIGDNAVKLNLFNEKGGIAAGTYFLKVSSGNEALTQQVVVLP